MQSLLWPARRGPAITLHEAVQYHQAGDLNKAAAAYQALLEEQPGNAQLMHLAGILHSQRGEHEQAVRSIGQAIGINPRSAALYSDLGLALHSAGRFTEAEAACRRALEIDPDFAEALFNLGNALCAASRPEEAAASYRSALEKNPAHARAHNNLGNCLRELGRPGEAAATYKQAIALDTRFADAWANLGLVHSDAGATEQAVRCFQRALEIDPRSAQTLYNLAGALLKMDSPGQALEAARLALELRPRFPEACLLAASALKQLQQFSMAAEWYRNTLDLRPGDPVALNGLGNALQELGEPAAAQDCFEEALRLHPDLVLTHYNLGNFFRARKRLADAEASYRRALDLDPDCGAAANNLGNVLEDQQRLEEALAFYRRALELDPDAAEAHSNLGNVLRRLGRLPEAERHSRRAVELKPDLWPAVNNLGAILSEQGRNQEALRFQRRALTLKPDHAVLWTNLGNVLAELRLLKEALLAYRKALELDPDDDNIAVALAIRCQQVCDWKEIGPLWKRSLEAQLSGRADPSPFNLLSMPSTPAGQLACARLWGKVHARGITPAKWDRRPPERERLRIGYLSADLRKHAVAYLAAELFELHDRRRFEVVGYSYGPDDSSAIRARLMLGFDRFADIRNSTHEQAAQLIQEDGVDILVDLTGITQHCRPRILAHRPAPIQVNYLGYPGTMGADFIDYILVDSFIAPPAQAEFFSEKLVWLPYCYQVNDRRREVSPRTPTRAECGLPERGLVLSSFSNTFKLTPEVFDIWMRILRETAGAVLWLIGDNATAEENLRREAQARGVSVDRLVFAPRCEMPDHLARQKLADLSIDTFPYNAHTTASDALWVGVPVVTLSGETFAARVAGSLLTSVGLPELVTRTPADYEALILRLARRPDELRAVREKLAANLAAAPLFATPRMTREIERAYERMWTLFREGRPPENITIEP